MSEAHDPPLREGHRGDALRGLDWVMISVPISAAFALRIAGLCFLGPAVGHGAGAASYRRRPEVVRQTRRRTLIIQRHGEGVDAPAGGDGLRCDPSTPLTDLGRDLPRGGVR